jgi:uracil-DNA glycosylase family 4
MRNDILIQLNNKIVKCERCERLRNYCQQVAVDKRTSFSQETYWGKPVPHFGDLNAQLLVVGLAPAAHGGNRTGRMFTGDRSGEWLYRALFEHGFANQYSYETANDGLVLKNALITAVAHCAPPDNKPSREEIMNCQDYLEEILQTVPWKTILCLGQLAWNEVHKVLKVKPEQKFTHGARTSLENYSQVLASFHPSQQNTFTKKLTKPMFDEIFIKSKINL